jgi:hypothetical protein
MITETNMVLGFSDFQMSKVNESESYKIPGIKDTWGGGYVISPVDLTVDGKESPSDKVIIPKKNETSIAICYVDSDGNESDYIWIPNDAISLKKDSDGSITEINIDPYKKWIAKENNKSRIEDFIEEFANHLELSKTTGQERIKQNAQDDVELLMDLIGIPGSIESFEDCGDYTWDATLDNGMLIEITKRSKEDLLSKFKIYLNSSDHHPCVYINNDSLNKKTSFKIPDMNVITVPKGFIEIKNPDPYIKYLTKRAMDIQNNSDEESLFNHYKRSVESGSEDREMLKNIAALLSEFMDNKDVEEISAKVPE